MDSELIRSSERRDKKDKIIGELYAAIQKLTSELGSTRERNMQIPGKFASVHQKLEGTKDRIGGG